MNGDETRMVGVGLPSPLDIEQIGSFKVRRFLAEGGMAWVFEVVDTRFDPPPRRALKMLKPDAAEGTEFQRFQSEASLLAEIDHPNLVMVFDFGKDEATGCFYYTMSLIEGPTLAERLNEEGPLSLDQAGPIFLSILDALGDLHQRGIVHRDIKPANIFGAKRRPRLGDLGIARVQQDASRTRTGVAMGTVNYMSPEQARGRPVDASSDVFSVGLTLYRTLTGQTVYDRVEDLDSTSGADVLGYLVALARMGRDFQITYPDGVDLHPAIAGVIERACRFRPEDRYPDGNAMRDALRDAFRQAFPRPEWQPARRPRFRLPLAGVLALGAGAIALYSMVLVPRQEASEIGKRLEATRALREQAAGLIESTKDLEPPPPREFVYRADREMERANDDLADAEEDLEASILAAAGAGIQRAARGYHEVCQGLVDTHLGERAQSRATEANASIEDLRSAGAPEYLAERWAELETRQAALAPPGEGALPCSAAEAHLVRIERAAETRAAVISAEQDLRQVWPQLANAARDDALTAKYKAEAEAVEVSPYRESIDSAQQALERGDGHREEGAFLRAREAYQEAGELFRTAAAVVPAARARAEARRLEKEIVGSGSEVGDWTALLGRADGLYRAGEWTLAASTYLEAVDRMTRGITDTALERAAQDMRTAALTAREAAVREGAEGSARTRFDRANAALGEAEGALKEARYQEAEDGFRSAAAAYREARDEAIEALAECRSAESAARRQREQLLANRGCTDFESATARDECEAGETGLARASEALAAGDAAAAQGGFSAAAAAYRRSAKAEAQFLDTKQWPPELVSRTPKREKLEVYRNESQPLAVEARDPNHDDLSYAWSFDGQLLNSTEPQIAFSPERSGRVEVTVSDGRGGAFRESWAIDILNREPNLSLLPHAEEFSLMVGNTLNFTAAVSDPDGDPVSTAFLLDGDEVASGREYRFTARNPGTHSLEVVATDAAGDTAILIRRIDIAEPPPPPKPVAAPPKPPKQPETRIVAAPPEPKKQPETRVAAKPPEPKKQPETRIAAKPPKPAVSSRKPPSKGLSQKDAALAALREYEAAYEARDIDRLTRVWVMNPSQRGAMEDMFRTLDRISVQIEHRGVQVTEDIVSVDFDQRIEAKGPRQMIKGETVPMTATVISRGGGRWIISSILPRR